MIRRKLRPEIDPDEPASKLAFPKSKYRPTEGRIEFDGLALPKERYLRDAAYRAWIRTKPCLLARFEKPCGTIGDRAPIEAAHLEHGGTGIKGSDASCIPLCPFHHDALDTETLPFQVIAFLWMSCWRLREEWHRRAVS